MSVEGLIVSLVFVVITVAIVAVPFARRGAALTAEDALLQKQRERLLIYYERVLTNVRDLEEDFRTGKMRQADFEAEREEWVQRGIQVLKALDEVGSHHVLVPTADEEALDRAIDREIEQAVAAHRRARA